MVIYLSLRKPFLIIKICNLFVYYMQHLNGRTSHVYNIYNLGLEHKLQDVHDCILDLTCFLAILFKVPTRRSFVSLVKVKT